MLLSPEDVESGAASWKMNRASNLNGGADVAVFFLLKYSGSCAGNGRHKTKVANGGGDDEGNRRKDPMAAFLELQIACVYFLCFLLHWVSLLPKNCDNKTRKKLTTSSRSAAQCDTMIPLIPVSSLNEMPEALASFRQTLETASPMDDDKQQLEATTTLLLKSCCVPEKPPLLEGQKDVLTSYVTESFADLAAKASSPEGQRELEQHLGEGDGRRVVDFFEAEIVLSG
jgi:hypothetical protein